MNIRQCKTLENLFTCSTKKAVKNLKFILLKVKKSQSDGDMSKQEARRQGSCCLETGSCDCEPGAHTGITKRPNSLLFPLTNMRLQKQKCGKQTSVVSSSAFRAGLIQHQPDCVALWFTVLVWSCSLWFMLTARDFLHLILSLISLLLS